MNGVCPLCQNVSVLVKSHVIPEFFLRAVFDERGRAIAVHGEPQPARLVQQAFRYRLLCDGCEQFINTEYEIPFLDFWREAVPGIVWVPFIC
jgi:hypothetical protein